MKKLISLIPIRVLFGINIAVGLVLFYFLAVVQGVEPGQFPWMMNFMFYAGFCYMMMTLVLKQTNPYHEISGYLGSFGILFGVCSYLIINSI